MIVEKLHSIKSKMGWQINILPSHQRKVSFQLYSLFDELANFGFYYDNAYTNKINPKLATMILGASTQTCVALLSKHIRSFSIKTSKLVKKIVNYINEKRWQSDNYHLSQGFYFPLRFGFVRLSNVLIPKKISPKKPIALVNVGEFGVTHNLFLSLNSQHISLLYINHLFISFTIVNYFLIFVISNIISSIFNPIVLQFTKILPTKQEVFT